MTWKPTDTRRETTCTPMDTRGPARLWHHPAGWVMRERGDVDGAVVHDYRCPVHGRFEARVSRRDMPDEVPCLAHAGGPLYMLAPWRRNADGTETWVSEHGQEFLVRDGAVLCGLPSPWSPSKFGAWASSGEVTG